MADRLIGADPGHKMSLRQRWNLPSDAELIAEAMAPAMGEVPAIELLGSVEDAFAKNRRAMRARKLFAQNVLRSAK